VLDRCHEGWALARLPLNEESPRLQSIKIYKGVVYPRKSLPVQDKHGDTPAACVVRALRDGLLGMGRPFGFELKADNWRLRLRKG